MTRRAAVSSASLSLCLVLAGCHHQQTSTPPPQAQAPVQARAEKVELAKAVHVGPASLYPNANLTPGKAATLSVADLTARYDSPCPAGTAPCTYSASHRDVSDSVHKQIYDEYKVPANKRDIQDGEVDHLYPMCAGGSNDTSNLWYQPVNNKWKGKNFGYHEKDALETHICKQIVAGKLDPKDAFKRITTDWVAWYQELGLDKKQDGDEEDIN